MRREASIQIVCEGHCEQHAVVAGLTMHLPDYAPSEEPCGNLCRTTLSGDGTAAACELCLEGCVSQGAARWDEREDALLFPADSPEEVRRRTRYLVGMSLYRAVCARKGASSPWGGLSGVRPAKVAASILKKGLDAGKCAAELCRVYGLAPDKARICTEAALSELSLGDSLSPGDAAVYIGIPFCPTVCGYCSFVSRHATPDALVGYCEALFAEIRALGEGMKRAGWRIRSLYIGGGTPTVLPAETISTLIAQIQAHLDLTFCDEFTVEAGRPDTVTEARLSALKAGGVTRICVNPQTLSDEVLASIGRRHTADDFRSAYAAARKASDWELNCDLIAGLPGESPEGFAAGLSEIVALSPEQITVHSLALKNASRMTEEKEGLSARLQEMLDVSERILREGGYRPYYIYRQKFSEGGENVGWMKENHFNAYNILMMEEMCSVFACGAGAVSKILRPGGLDRLANPKYPDAYIDRIEEICAKKRSISPPCTGV
ncbi:MAG: coproporphyrinogen dehydrogenase HemZ [Clostridia bacterium]|nr:coproporphyrinogen dehydrogenase HemZ [Clostridia bacterium]